MTVIFVGFLLVFLVWLLWKRGILLAEKEVLGVLSFHHWRNLDELASILAREKGFLGDPRKNLRVALGPVLQKFLIDGWVKSRDGLLVCNDDGKPSDPEKEFLLTPQGAEIRKKWLRH